MWPFRRKRGRQLFRSHELAVIDALRAALPPEGAPLYDRQIDGVEIVQRLNYEYEEVCTYPNRRGPQVHDPMIAFPNRSLDLKLATIELRGANGQGKAVVRAVGGHVFSYTFRPRARELGPPDSIIVTKTTLHVDPTKPDDAGAAGRLVEELALPVRAELEAIWAERPDWAKDVVDADGAYRIELDDGSFLVLAQLEDTTYVVAGTDPPRAGIRRYEPTGELLGEYASVQEAVLARLA